MLGESAAQSTRNINKVWGEGGMNECTEQYWYKRVRLGNSSFENELYDSV